MSENSTGVEVMGFEVVMNSPGEVLRRGNFGTTYQVVLRSGLVVVAKMLREECVPDREFREKVEELGKMTHENLLSLKAYSRGMTRWLLLYEYMPMGSLSDHLHGNEEACRSPAPLSWEVRSRNAYKVARAVEYLHSPGPAFCHGNIKTSNIFLINSYNIRVSEYGLAQLHSPSSKPCHILSCSAPEMTNAYRVSQKVDIYSFGVLLLELLTGLAPLHALPDKKGVDLPKWVRFIVQDKPMFVVFDRKLPRNGSVEDQMI